MADETKNRRDAELDAFWDISDLLPRKKPYSPPPRKSTEAIEVQVRTCSNAGKGIPREDLRLPRREEMPTPRFVPPHTAEEQKPMPPMEEYEPQDSLLHKVRLYPWKSTYHYYDVFVTDAERLWLLRGSEVPRIPFFSYVPQYSQLSRAQLAWYLWWRDRFRHGEALPTDYSYLLLFAYELINLSGKTEPMQTQEYLLRLWQSYRETYPQINSYLPEWICDYSLIHRLSPPVIKEGGTLSSLLSHCTLREFYIRGEGKHGYANALLAFCCNHNYRKSKFYNDETQSLYDRVIPEVLAEVIERMSDRDKLFSTVGMEDSRLLRDAYTGALCSYRFKRKIEVEFASFSRSHELRFLVTDIVKHIENALRAHHGVRSRLSVDSLPMPVRECLDTLLPDYLPAKKPSFTKEERPAYERQYDVAHTELSFAGAEAIERASWETTERLLGAFEEESSAPLPSPPPSPIPVPERVSPTEKEGWMQALAPYRDFLAGVAEEDALAQRRAATALGMLPDLVADRINETAADAFGDVLLEEAANGYAVIEDYHDLLNIWLREQDCSCKERRNEDGEL